MTEEAKIEVVFEEESNEVGVYAVGFPVSGSLLWFDYPSFLEESRYFPHNIGLVERPYLREPLAPITWSSNWNRYALDAVMDKARLYKVPFDAKFLKNKTCSLIWSKHPKTNARLFFQLQAHQRFNHIPGTKHLTRKDCLAMILTDKKTDKKVGEEFDFFPDTYALLDQNKEFKEALGMKKVSETNQPVATSGAVKRVSVITYNNRKSMKRSGEDEKLWIIKPVGGPKATDFKIYSQEYVYERTNRCLTPTIAQKYITNPLLINKKKFDIRFYVLITGFSPLKVYVYPEGTVRFCEDEYQSPSSVSATIKRSKSKLKDFNFAQFSNLRSESFSCEENSWSFDQFKAEIGEDKFDTIVEEIKSCIVKTCIATSSSVLKEQEKLGNQFEGKDKLCFELLTFDFMVDDSLKPWLLETNLSPSLSTGCCERCRQMKTKLLCDVLYLVGIPYKNENRKDQYHYQRNVQPTPKEKKGLVSTLRKNMSIGLEQTRQKKYTSWSTNRDSKSLFTLVGGQGAESKMLEDLDHKTREKIAIVCEEYMRRGNFERLFPPNPTQKEAAKKLTQLFPQKEQYVNCLVKDFEGETFEMLFARNIEEFA